MKWQLLVNRDKDFLKNCLLYESLVKEYRKYWGISHPPFLTDRIGNTFTHFISKKGYEQLDNHILNKLKKRKIIKSIETEGVKRFNQLIDFCKGTKKYQQYTNKELLGLIKRYFCLYKKAYPYFQICIDLTYCEKSISRLSKEEIDKLTKFRTFGRLSFEKAHSYSELLFKEIGKRFRLNIQELKFLTPKEIYNVLSGEKVDVKKKSKIDKNVSLCS